MNNNWERTTFSATRGVAAVAWLVLICGIGALRPASAKNPQATFGSAEFRAKVSPFLEQHCAHCHGADVQEGGVRFDRLPNGYDLIDANLWARVYHVLKEGKMPPEGETQPKAEEKTRLAEWIIVQHRAAREVHGSGSRRRLNRREYANLVTAVLGLNLPQFDNYLPGDRKIDGFDTVATGLQDATASVNANIEAVHMLLKRVDFLESSPLPERLLAGNLVTKQHNGDGRELQISVRGGGDPIEPLPVNPSKRAGSRGKGIEISVSYDQADFEGFLRIRFEVASLAPKGVAPPTLRFDAERRFEITGDAGHPQTVEFLVLPGDEVPRVWRHPERPTRYAYSLFVANQQTLPFDPEVSTGHKGAADPKENFKEAVKKKDTSYPASWLQFQSYEVEPSYRHQWLSEREQGTIPANDSGALVVIERLARGAFRRPLSAAEQNWLHSFYKSSRKEGLGLDEAIRLTAELIFTSAPARTLLPTDVDDPVLRQYAIASRLSFGLLTQPPDERLLNLAAAGKLTEAGVIQQEVDRLLSHPDSQAGFLEPFARMWLELDQPKTLVKQQGQSHKELLQPNYLHMYREHILAGMERESAAYFGIMLEENLPARELIDSDWLPMNDAMAYHYEYPRIIGHEFQKVKLKPDDPRGGGMMGQAGVMAMTTWMGPNWPTYRGAWVLRHVLNHPPPPPPVAVPELDHEDHKGKPIKAKLAAHTQAAECAACHKTLDPVGHAFQHFDVSGRWQSEEAESYQINTDEGGSSRYVRSGDKWPIDATGQLPGGEAFTNWPEFKQMAVLHYTDDVVRGQLQRYVRFFASRRPDVGDEAVIEKIMDQDRKQGYPMRDMLKEFLCSEIFLGTR